jgi:hypothetical protein
LVERSSGSTLIREAISHQLKAKKPANQQVFAFNPQFGLFLESAQFAQFYPLNIIPFFLLSGLIHFDRPFHL